MSARLTTLLRFDARLQMRYGIYYAYGFVILFYALALTYLGAYLPGWMIAIIIYTDPALLGFFFLGALMMLEKAESTRTALAMTPVSAADYVTSKAATLTTVSIVAVIVIAALAHADTNWAVLLPASVLTSLCYVGIGVPTALRFRTATSYLIGSTGYLLPVVLPAGLALFDPMPVWAIIVPTASQLKLIAIGIGAGTASGAEIAAMFAVTALSAAGALWLGVASLKKELGNK